MKKAVIILSATLLSVLFSLSGYAQDNFAVIKDPDGYSNVRKKDAKSKIVGQIMQYQLFDCMDDEETMVEPPFANMVYINYYSYGAKKGCNFLENKNGGEGYIHKSRVYRLNDMPRLKRTSVTENKAIFANDSLKVSIEIAPFDAKKHILRDEKNKEIKPTEWVSTSFNFIETIDGQEAWGAADCGVPDNELKSIKINYKDTTLVFPSNSIKNIFTLNPDSDFTKICIGSDGEIYIWLQNGDGACSYNVIWVIVNRKIKYRFTALGYYV